MEGPQKPTPLLGEGYKILKKSLHKIIAESKIGMIEYLLIK